MRRGGGDFVGEEGGAEAGRRSAQGNSATTDSHRSIASLSCPCGRIVLPGRQGSIVSHGAGEGKPRGRAQRRKWLRVSVSATAISLILLCASASPGSSFRTCSQIAPAWGYR